MRELDIDKEVLKLENAKLRLALRSFVDMFDRALNDKGGFVFSEQELARIKAIQSLI